MPYSLHSHIPALANQNVQTIQTNPLDNQKSTADTIAQMVMLVQESLHSQEIVWASEQVLKKINKATPSQDDIIRACFWWTKGNLQFTQDENILINEFGIVDMQIGKDLLISPIIFIQYIQANQPAFGDCDDFSMLLAALLINLGVSNVWFRTIAADPNEPNFFSHVYVVAENVQGESIALDSSHAPYPGWETKNIYKQADWYVGSGTPNSLANVPNPVSTNIPSGSGSGNFNPLDVYSYLQMFGL